MEELWVGLGLRQLMRLWSVCWPHALRSSDSAILTFEGLTGEDGAVTLEMRLVSSPVPTLGIRPPWALAHSVLH